MLNTLYRRLLFGFDQAERGLESLFRFSQVYKEIPQLEKIDACIHVNHVV
jgi:hypothetical protein